MFVERLDIRQIKQAESDQVQRFYCCDFVAERIKDERDIINGSVGRGSSFFLKLW